MGSAVQLVTDGIKVGAYRPDDTDEEVEIRVRFPSSDRSIDQLDRLRVPTREGAVPITNFVTRKAVPRTGTINRSDGRRVLTVEAEVPDGVLVDDKVNQIKQWLAGAALDSRIEIDFKGEDREQREAEAFLLKAFGVALFLMAIILVTQFNSFYQAFLILSAVVLSTIGVLLGLLITDQPFGIVMSGVGVIALAGIVVNNNIVADRHVQHLAPRRHGGGRSGAENRGLASAPRPAHHLHHHPRTATDGAGRSTSMSSAATSRWGALPRSGGRSSPPRSPVASPSPPS